MFLAIWLTGAPGFFFTAARNCFCRWPLGARLVVDRFLDGRVLGLPLVGFPSPRFAKASPEPASFVVKFAKAGFDGFAGLVKNIRREKRRITGYAPMLAPMSRPERTPRQKALVGPAGEAYVLFRLYQQGILASLAPPGSPTVDILVLAPDESVIASLQVKTRTYGRDRGWHMRDKHESIIHERYFYAFVDLEPQAPVTYIVPSAVVAEVLHISHQAWLATPGLGGRPHKDGPTRRVVPDYGSLAIPNYPPGWLDSYCEQWELLKAVISD